MKRRYILLLFFIATLPSMAQQIFIEKGGRREAIDFNKFEKITFNGTTVNVLQTDGTTTSASMGEIERIFFSNYSDIENIEVKSGSPINYISKDYISLNCKAGDVVTIYNIIGTQLICTRLKSDNDIISIAHLPKGVYIVKFSDKTAKFVKR